jgi:hypothetical protein
MMLAEALKAVDPGSGDPSYWLRFRASVVSGAGRELARRRLLAELTVGDVLTSWARAVVPTAALAAALAAIVLMRAGSAVQAQPIGVEELLVSELPSERVPALLAPDAAEEMVVFASDMF